MVVFLIKGVGNPSLIIEKSDLAQFFAGEESISAQGMLRCSGAENTSFM